MIAGYFYRNDGKHFDDYNSILVQKEDWNSKFQNSQSWKTKTSKKKVQYFSIRLFIIYHFPIQIYFIFLFQSLNVMCLNPAVVYNPINKIARCIILTSGTLTPTISFPAELGSEFPINLQTGHVISRNQVKIFETLIFRTLVHISILYFMKLFICEFIVFFLHRFG